MAQAADPLAAVTSSDVGVLVRVVPDGFVGDKLRLSLVLAPDTRACRRGKTFPLHEWPTHVGELIEKIRVYAGAPAAAHPLASRDFDRSALLGAQALLDADQRRHAQRLWLEIFCADAGGAQAGFAKLYAMLQEEQGVAKDQRAVAANAPRRRAKTTANVLNKIGFKKNSKGGDTLNVYSYRVAEVARIIKLLRLAETAAQVSLNWGRSGSTPKPIGPTFRGLLGGRFWAADDSQARDLCWRVSSTTPEGAGVTTLSSSDRVVTYFARALDAGGFAPFVNGDGGALGRMSSPRAALRGEILDFLRGGTRAGDGIVATDQQRNAILVTERLSWQESLRGRRSGGAGLLAATPVTTPAARVALDGLRTVTYDTTKSLMAPFLGNFLVNGQGDEPQLVAPINTAGVMQRLSENLVRAEMTWLADRIETEIARLQPSNRHGEEDIPDDPLDPARRKFHGIMGHANLARFLGLVVDITLDSTAAAALIGAGSSGVSVFGELAADLWGGDVAPSGDPMIWTAFKYLKASPPAPTPTPTPTTPAKPGFFGPATSYEWAAGLDESSMPYRNGLLDLSARMQVVGDDGNPILGPDGQPTTASRYELVSLDVSTAINAIRSRAQNQANAYERGTLDTDLASTFPSSQTRGIALLDRARADDVVKEIVDAKANQANADAASVPGAQFSDRLVLKAEDLTIGCRVDVGLASGTGKAADAYWGSITARRIDYRDHRIPAAARRVPRDFLSREDSSVCPATKEHMVDQGDVEAVAAAQAVAAAGNLNINGVYADSGRATFDDVYRVTIVTQKPNPGVSFKIQGTDKNGAAIGETIAGPSTDAPVETSQSFKSVTQVTASAPVTGNVQIGIDGAGAAVMAHETICTWTGESLGVPPARTYMDLEPLKELAVELCYDLPADSDAEVMPPLRNGQNYFVGARLVYINQGGLSFEEARERYRHDAPSMVIGADDSADPGDPAPYPFVLHEKIARPDVLLPANDPLVTDLGSKIHFPGDQIDVLVVRSGEMLERAAVRRFIAPAGVSFDFAEQFGAFDDDDEHIPRGAMRDVDLCEGGAYPVATDSGRTCPSTLEVSATDADKTNVRGPYLEFGGEQQGNARLYPHPAARWARLALTDGDVQRGDTFAVRYWTQKQKWRDARPVLLSVVRMKDWRVGNPTTAEFDASVSLERISDVGSARPGTARHVQLRVAPAEEVTLQIWSEPDADVLTGRFWIGSNWLNFIQSCGSVRFAGPVPPGDPFAQLYELAGKIGAETGKKFVSPPPLDTDGLLQSQSLTILPATPMTVFSGRQTGPVAGVSTRRALKVIHAVQRPLVVPTVSRDSSTPAKLRFNAVGIPQPEKWGDYVAHPPNGSTDELTWPTQPNGQSWFLTGFLGLDRRSTGVIRCEGFWDEYDDSSPQRDAHGNFVFSPKPGQDTLFTIQNLPRSGDEPLGLLRNESNDVRGLSYSFPARYPKEKARRVRLRVVATSRYPKFFTTDTGEEQPSATGALSKFETESVAARTAAALDLEQKFETAVWFKSSVRPPAPPLDCILPNFLWEVRENKPGRRFKITRRSMLNVRLQANEWFKSGEDEKMGLVCWPPDLFDASPSLPAPGAELATRVTVLKENEPLVTAWGSDPIRLSGANEPLIEAKRFFGHNTKFTPAKVLLPPPEGTPPSGSSPSPADIAHRAVVVLPFDAVLNPAQGYRECKIGIHPGRNYSPIVRLGLVRYQPHAIAEYEISRPVVETVPVQPTRHVVVEVLERGKKIRLLVYGQGFHRAQPGLVAPPAGVDVHHPLLNVRLLRASDDDDVPSAADGTIAWKPVLNDKHCPIEFPLQPPQVVDPARGRVLWHCDVPLPTYRSEVHYGIEIDEVIMMPEDDADGRGTVFKPGAPVFSYSVDLWREPAIPGGPGRGRRSRADQAAEGMDEGSNIITVPDDEW